MPWYQADGFVRAAEELSGVPASRLASDGHPAFGIDASDDLIALRLALSPAKTDDLGELGARTAGEPGAMAPCRA